ncbi:hypothetical protein VTL71DRAFT_14297 [Oculimacula yallundae]|uniref:SWIM-type domain-containing protein n=1 Tax=Oculimacula yallundae TaxID=86028 RepID=A0ABR4CI25_9HELO
MSSGTFNMGSNTLFMPPGLFPSWWAPLTPAPDYCEIISTWHIECGCVNVSTVHSETCKHSHILTTEDWDRAIERTEMCERPRVSITDGEGFCKVNDDCRLHRRVKVEYPALPAPWDTYIPYKRLEINLEADHNRRMAIEEIARDNATDKRFLEIGYAWAIHAVNLLRKGVLELQPNVIAEEDGEVYECTYERLADGVIEIKTC